MEPAFVMESAHNDMCTLIRLCKGHGDEREDKIVSAGKPAYLD